MHAYFGFSFIYAHNYDIIRRFIENNNLAEHPLAETYDRMSWEELETYHGLVTRRSFATSKNSRSICRSGRTPIGVGQKDGTMSDDLPPIQLAQIIMIYISGILDQLILQREALEHIKFP